MIDAASTIAGLIVGGGLGTIADDGDRGASASQTGLSRAEPEVSALRASIPSAGDVFHVRYPFIRETVTLCGEDGFYEARTWRPGVSIENVGPYGEDTDIVANGEGEMILTVVDTFKPGRFPRRVFYTRQFVDPNGYRFGKSGLRMTTVDAFRRRASGYQLAYDVEDMGRD